jgi:hypothetical protein
MVTGAKIYYWIMIMVNGLIFGVWQHSFIAGLSCWGIMMCIFFLIDEVIDVIKLNR